MLFFTVFINIFPTLLKVFITSICLAIGSISIIWLIYTNCPVIFMLLKFTKVKSLLKMKCVPLTVKSILLDDFQWGKKAFQMHVNNATPFKTWENSQVIMKCIKTFFLWNMESESRTDRQIELNESMRYFLGRNCKNVTLCYSLPYVWIFFFHFVDLRRSWVLEPKTTSSLKNYLSIYI